MYKSILKMFKALNCVNSSNSLNLNCYNSHDSQICLNMLKHVWTCSDSIWYELLWFMWFSNMSEHVEICLNLFRSYDMNYYDSCDSQTCLNLFRFNMIQIVMIHVILKHVWTCSDSLRYKLLSFMWFSNMSEHVETCLNLFRFNMVWIVMIHMILKHVWTCSTCVNLFRFNMIRIDTILKHVQTCQNAIDFS